MLKQYPFPICLSFIFRLSCWDMICDRSLQGHYPVVIWDLGVKSISCSTHPYSKQHCSSARQSLKLKGFKENGHGTRCEILQAWLELWNLKRSDLRLSFNEASISRKRCTFCDFLSNLFSKGIPFSPLKMAFGNSTTCSYFFPIKNGGLCILSTSSAKG